MAARLCCTPDRKQRRRRAEHELTVQQTPTKKHEDKDSHSQRTPSSSPGELAECPAMRAVRPYRLRGTCGTFAGRRPPKDVTKLQKFEEDREKHLEQKCRKRRSTSMMQSYRDFVQQTLPLETEGSGGERLRRVAAKWKHRPAMHDQLALENQKVM